MFTGIITDIGEIIDIKDNDHRLIKVACSYNSKEIDIGAVSYTHLTLPTTPYV